MAFQDTPISPRQSEVLKLVKTHFNGNMLATSVNYRQIAKHIGWKNSSGVVDCLFALRAKGAVRTLGPLSTRPERWVIQ